MVYELSDTSKAAVLFDDWPETLITSCLQKVMGRVYVTDLEQPKSALAFVSSFESKEQYLELGRGVVLMKNGKIVSGASSYSRYREGIEIEVDTVPEERNKGLATIVCAALILGCHNGQIGRAHV